MSNLEIRSITTEDEEWVKSVLSSEWGSTLVVSRGVLHHAERLPGLVASNGEDRVGLLTFLPAQGDCEIVTLNVLVRRKGVGRKLLAEMKALGRRENWRRLWLVTTNDNVPAQKFYRACGWELAKIHRGAVREARTLKPQIPLNGHDGIPIEDEYEYKVSLR